MRVGFYLANAKIADVSFAAPERGNPGIGGSHFLVGVLPYYLEKFAGERIVPVVYANRPQSVPVSESVFADDVLSAMRQAKSDGCECFVDIAKEIPRQVVAEADRLALPTVLWIHNVVRHTHLRDAARSSYIRRVVCSGHEIYDYLRDHWIADKLAMTPNGFDCQAFSPKRSVEKDPKTVVYLGNIVKQKGFHIVARVWPRVLERFPDAKLRVVGTGRLYDRSIPLGPWGIATEAYERKYLIPHLSGSNGQPHPSVEFLGLLGGDRVQVLQRAGVGVINPSGETENCPGSALELQAAGTAVVSGAYWGVMDTVVHGHTGLLGRTDSDLVENICALLGDPMRAVKMGEAGIAYVQNKYDYRTIVEAWVRTLDEVVRGERPCRLPAKPNKFRHAKILRLTNEAIKQLLPALKPLPSVGETANGMRAVKRALRRGQPFRR